MSSTKPDSEAARRVLLAISPRNELERAAKESLQRALNQAAATYSVGKSLHWYVTRTDESSFSAYLSVPIALGSAQQFVEACRGALIRHITDTQAHAAQPKRVTFPVYDTLSDTQTQANGLKALFNEHVSQLGIHLGGDILDVPISVTAVDDGSLVTLLEELRSKVLRHIGSSSVLRFAPSPVSDASAYREALKRYEVQSTAAATAFKAAELAARAGARSLGYAPSPAWTPTANRAVLDERLNELQAQGTFAGNEYCVSVVLPAHAALYSNPPPGNLPSPPPANASSTQLVVGGTVNPTSESALLEVMGNIHEFAAGFGAY